MIQAMTVLPPGQWVARAAVAALPVVALLCVRAAGATTPTWLVVVVALVSLYWAAVPESPAGAAALAVVAVWWGLEVGADIDPFALLAAAAVLVAHVAAMRLDPAVVRLWLRRAALIYLPVPALYLVAAWAQGMSGSTGWWLAGLTATFSAIAVMSVTLSVHRREDPTSGRA
jgi:hypothetical protein